MRVAVRVTQECGRDDDSDVSVFDRCCHAVIPHQTAAKEIRTTVDIYRAYLVARSSYSVASISRTSVNGITIKLRAFRAVELVFSEGTRNTMSRIEFLLRTDKKGELGEVKDWDIRIVIYGAIHPGADRPNPHLICRKWLQECLQVAIFSLAQAFCVNFFRQYHRHAGEPIYPSFGILEPYPKARSSSRKEYGRS